MRRPTITLKLATSIDGKIALSNGQSEWITGKKAREAGRKLRATHDAICVGSGTVIADNPQLTTRIAGHPNPIRVVFDSNIILPPQSDLAQTARDVPVWVFCKDGQYEKAAELQSLGVRIFPVTYDDGLDIAAALTSLKTHGVNSLLLEGGGRLAASFVKLGVIDRIEWFRASTILGGDGRDAIGPLGLEHMQDRYDFDRIDIQDHGEDVQERYERKH